MIDFLLKIGFQMYKHCDCEGGKRWFKKQAMPGTIRDKKKQQDN
jgi:hypothetical protein